MQDTPGLSPFRNPLSGLMRAPRRFPVPLACAAAWAAITIIRDLDIGELSRDIIQSLQVLFLSGLFLSLAATLFAEGRGWRWLRSLGLALAALALTALAVYLDDAPDPWEGPGFYLIAPAGMLAMIVAPFLRRGADDRAVWDFNLVSWLSVLFGLTVAVGLGFGAMALLGGLETLFGLDFDGDYYDVSWIICMSLIWPWQTLAGIPGVCEEGADRAPPRWAEYLVSWLLVPLAVAYLLLLYGFAAKSMLTWNLPRGTVGWLVGGFAAYGLAAWSAAWPFRETGMRLVRLYHRYFHYLLVVPVILLAVGVGIRIAEYGITEKRYALILLTVWLGGIALYSVLARPARLAVAPAVFAAMLLLGAIGPWGATSVSIRSQLGQLEELLSEAGILIDGRIAPESGLAGPKEVKRISGIVRYLRREGRRDDLEQWLKGAGAEPKGDEDNQALLALIGLDYVEEWEEDGRFYYAVSRPETVDIAGFDVAQDLYLGDADAIEVGVVDGRRYEIARKGGRVTVTEVGQSGNRVDFDLVALAESVRGVELLYNDEASNRALTLDAAANGLRARLYVENLRGRRSSFGNNEVEHGNALLLIGRAD